MFSVWRYSSILALVTLVSLNLSASLMEPIIEGRLIQNGTSSLLSFNPSSCRPISGQNPWALGLTSEALDTQSDLKASDHTSKAKSWSKRDGSTILQLNPLASANISAPFGVGNQCETIALLDFRTRPQDGGTNSYLPLHTNTLFQLG